MWPHWIAEGWFDWEPDGWPFWSHHHHLSTWWQFRELPNVLLVHFGDLKSDPETEKDFASYFGELLAIKLRSRLRAPEVIQDVTQETFLRVLRTLRESGIENPEALGSFVNSVCTNVLFEVYRAQSRVAEPVEDRISDEIGADTAMADEEVRTQVRSVLSELPEKDRKILRWLFFDERDKGEVCRVLQVDREYLRVLVHRAKQRFRTDYLRRVATKANPATPLG